MIKFIFLVSLIGFLNYSQCARILGVFQMPSLSHQRVFRPLCRELSLRGHQVTVVTPWPLNDPSLVNLTEIDVSYTQKIFLRYGFQHFMSKLIYVHKKVRTIFELNYELAHAMFQDENFIKVYNNSEAKFDLIIAQTYVSPIMYSLSAKLNVPIIGISSMGGWVGTHFAVGNPTPPWLYSEMFLPYHLDMTLYERICSTLYHLWARVFLTFEALPKCDKIARTYLGNDLPYLGEVEKNLSLVFLTTNPILYTPRPTIPTIIPIQQLHIRPSKPLPEDLKAVLDAAKEGAILFSLGSNVMSVDTPDRLKKVLLETFAELPYQIIWKWESDNFPGKPKNVFSGKWLPQQDILAHPNIKAFVTQCGLQSIEEAVVYGVPIIGMPFIADQTSNVKRLVDVGVAIGIEYLTVTKDELKSAIIEAVENPKYKKNIENLRALLWDEPMGSLEKAVWWSEYVIRHKGTKHLRSPTVDVPWWKYLLLDVLLVALLTLAVVSFIVVKTIKLIFSYIRTQTKAKQS